MSKIVVPAHRGRRRGARRARVRHFVAVTFALCGVLLSGVAGADEPALPSPLDATFVVRLARERRDEVTAAHARALAAAQRPRIVSALPDPMVAVTVDHVPFDFHMINGNVTIQQEFPLSGVLGNRRRAAEADADRWGANTRRVALDVELEALQAFYMLAERRGTAPILDEQVAVTDQLVVIARAHLAAGQSTLADVLRLDNELARFRAERRAVDAESRGAEAMLDTALAREPTAAIPELAWADDVRDPEGLDALARKAIAGRPELAAARADRRRSLAEVDTMQSMYGPMALVRAGPSYMTSDGPGVMVMVGISIPLGRGRLAAGVDEAHAMVTMATAEITAMQRMIVGNIAVARERVLAERTRLLAIQQDILPRARLVVASAMGSFAAGQGTMLAVLDSTRDLREIRMQELMARVKLSNAWARLRRETGS